MTRELRVQWECEACPCGRASRATGTSCPFSEEAHERGATLFHAGDLAERVWFVKRGTIVLTRANGEPGAGRARAVRRDGAFVGLEALVRGRYLDTARASEPTIACVAPLAQVDAWLGAPGTPARTALEQVLRAEVAEPPHAASPDGTATQRVARWILDAAGASDTRPLMRRDVAGLLGMVPETFSRALAELVRLGAVAANRRHVTIVDLGVLTRAAGVGGGGGGGGRAAVTA
jgi:CRP-like cAMP-binding protein